MSEFREGFLFWWRGWGQLKRSRALAFYAVLPFLLAFCFFAAVFYITVTHLSDWANTFITELLPSATFWSKLLHYPLWLTLFVVSFLALLYFSYLVCILLCGPFYAVLAERSLRDLGKAQQIGWSTSLRTIGSGILKSVIFAVLGGTLLIFSFVPLINVIGLALMLLILSFDTMDYAFDALGLRLNDRFGYFSRHLSQWLGMATSLAVTLLVPGLTLLILPGAVVGAAMIIDVQDRAIKKA